MTPLQHSIMVKNPSTDNYKASQPMVHNFYLLSLLLDNCANNIKYLISFYKNSSISCWTTDQLFLNKNGKNIELFSVHDLARNENLCLPKVSKFILSKKNFINCIMQIQKLHKQAASKIYIAVDELGTVHITDDLASIKKYDFFSLLLSSIKTFFIKK